jgi:hypothetical protein
MPREIFRPKREEVPLLERKSTLGKCRRVWEKHIKIDLEKTGCEDVK